MGTQLSQIYSVTAMNLQSLPRRLWMSLAMVLASAIVVAILLAFLAMAKGFDVTLQSAGSSNIAILMREASAAELNSAITREQVNLIEAAEGVAHDEQGPIASPELYVIVDGTKKSSQTDANIPLRGLNQRGFAMRGNAKIIAGRMFTTGTNELIVGAGVLRQFDGFELDKVVKFGKNSWKVVGVFSTGGNVFESELWADVNVLQNLYNRGSSYQTIRVQLASETALQSIQDLVDKDPRLNLDVETEASYFATQGKQLRYIALFGQVISSIMALGALAGALNTMYTSVAQRSKEIATLRAIGFSNLSAFMGTLIEAMSLATLGGLIGALLAFIFFDGINASTLGGSFTQVVFSFKLTADLILQGIIMALLIGFISGFFPAWKAARTPVVLAFHSNH